MDINAVDNATIGYNAITALAAGDQQNAQEDEANSTPQIADPSDTTGGIIDTVELSDKEGQKMKGVLRLLQQGHFKGVADVRLRINFNDEITAMEQAEAARVSQEGVSGLMDYVNSEIETLLQAGELDELTAAAIGEAQNIFNSSLLQDTDDPISQLRLGFDELVSSLNSTFAPPEETTIEEPTETTVPAENPIEVASKALATPEDEILTPEETSTFDYEQFITQLVETFATKINELEASLTDIRVLPELSEPRGNGAAYQKFLAIYNDIRGNAEPVAMPVAVDTLT